MTKFELRTAISVGLIYLVRMLGLFMVLPVIALAVPDYAEATPLLVGLVLGAYGLTQALLQVPLGYLSDRVGRRPVLVGALLVLLLGSVMAAMADNVYLLILGRALQGCGAVAGTLLALVSDLTRVDHRSKAMAIIGGFISLAFGLSLVFGPVLFEFGGLDAIFSATAAAAAVAILIVFTLLPEPASRALAPADNGILGKVAFDPQLVRVYISIFLLHMLLMLGFSAFPLELERLGIPLAQHPGYYLVILVVSLVLMYPLMRRAAEPGGNRPVLLVAITILGTSLLLAIILQSWWGLPLALLVFFVGFNLLEVVLPALLSQIAPAGARGAAMGMYATWQFGGVFAGGLVSGLLLLVGDATYIYTAGAALAVLWFGLILGLKNPGNVASRMLPVDPAAGISANQMMEQLSSVDGVIDVVVIESEGVAYLKVDTDVFSDEAVPNLVR